MADAVKAARKYLQGLSGDKPWETPLSSHPVSKPTPKAESKPASKAAPKDDIGEQVDKITKRNEDLAKRTRHLREGSRRY